MKCQSAVSLVHRVRAKVRDASLHDSFIFVSGTHVTVVGYEFRKVGADQLDGKSTIGFENGNPVIRAKVPGSWALVCPCVRDERPASQKLGFVYFCHLLRG